MKFSHKQHLKISKANHKSQISVNTVTNPIITFATVFANNVKMKGEKELRILSLNLEKSHYFEILKPIASKFTRMNKHFFKMNCYSRPTFDKRN